MFEFQNIFKSFADKIKYFNRLKPANELVLFSNMDCATFPGMSYSDLKEMVKVYSETGTIDYKEIWMSSKLSSKRDDISDTALIEYVYSRLWMISIPWNYYRKNPFDYQSSVAMCKQLYSTIYHKEMTAEREKSLLDNIHLLVESHEKILDHLTPYVRKAVLGELSNLEPDIPYMKIVEELGKIYPGNVKEYQEMCRKALSWYTHLLSLKNMLSIVWEAFLSAFRNLKDKWIDFLTKESQIDILSDRIIYYIAERKPVVYIVYGTILKETVREFTTVLMTDSKKHTEFFTEMDDAPRGATSFHF